VNSVVTVPAAQKAEIVKKKLKLVKPYYDPKWDEPPPPPAPEPEPKPKKSKKNIVTTSKFERGMRKRLKALQELFSDPRMAERLKIQVSKHVIKIPSKATDMEKALHKLLIQERKRWVKYLNQNPRNKMTDNKAHDIIEKLAGKR